jgi:DNA polymerase III sliding clamp (beta) subunit (PCNA family)
MIEVSAAYFRAAAECQSNEDTRYYLQGVYIQPHPVKGAILTATDGHRLISIYDEEGTCPAAKIIAIDRREIDARAIAAMKKAKILSPKVCVDDDGIATIGTYRSLKSCVIDGTYPDWKAVLKPVLAGCKEGKFMPASFNHTYLAEFGKISAMLSRSGEDIAASIRMISFSESDPTLIRFGSDDVAFAILMPMRATTSNSVPSWMRPILEPALAPVPTPAVQSKNKASRTVRKSIAKTKEKKPAKRRTAR